MGVIVRLNNKQVNNVTAAHMSELIKDLDKVVMAKRSQKLFGL